MKSRRQSTMSAMSVYQFVRPAEARFIPAQASAFRAEIETSSLSAERLYEALAGSTNEFVLTSLDGALAVRVRLRLFEAARTQHQIGRATVTIDWSSAQLERAGRSIALSRTELRLLAVFLTDQGRVLTRAQLIDRLWPDDELLASGRENALAVYVCSLRKRLAAAGLRGVIVTIRNAGYRLA